MMTLKTGAPARLPRRRAAAETAVQALAGPTATTPVLDARVAVIGLGYTGLPLAISFVEAGLEVQGIDVVASRVAELNAGTSPIDDISDGRLIAALDATLSIVVPDGAT